MEKMIDNIIEIVKKYDDNTKIIEKAYNYASKVHGNQKRKSGELYINHPLTVGYILALIHADTATICAGILHDVIEDGINITKDDIEKEFGSDIAILTDGVTKMNLSMFKDKNSQNNANKRKIVTSILKDVRIIYIKLADRLHNMLTIKHLSREKQIENACETLNVYVHLASYLGLYNFKNLLEELSFEILNKDIYNIITEKRNIYINDNYHHLENMFNDIKHKLNDENIKNNISYRYKRNYSIYKKITNKLNINITDSLLTLTIDDILPYLVINDDQIHDLQSLKILVTNIEDCYKTLSILQNTYETVPGKVKNCITHPKTNGYQSLHTTLKNDHNQNVQMQIRTKDMDLFASNGLAAHWVLDYKTSVKNMQSDLIKKIPIAASLELLDKTYDKDDDYIEHLNKEILTERIYPFYTNSGKIIELPIGSTIMDFICRSNINLNTGLTFLVNGKIVNPDYILSSKDTVEVIQIPGKKLTKTMNYITTEAFLKIKQLN